jgi:Phosphodiester glycosidase
MSRRVPGGGSRPEWPAEPGSGPANGGDRGAPSPGQPPQAYEYRGQQRSGQLNPTRPDNPRYQSPGGYGAAPAAGGPNNQAPGPPQNQQNQPPQAWPPQDQGPPGAPPGQPAPAPDQPPARKPRFRRTRRFFRRPTVRVISAVLVVFLAWVAFSVGQAATKNNGQGLAANVAEWARDHGLGPVVTFGEYLSYNPPPKGGKPSFSLAVPSGAAVTPSSSTSKAATSKSKGFVPDIPATLKSLAGTSIAGEGQWRVAEKVKGEPAMLTTFLRDATYTSEVNGIASIDQRLVKFSLRPGSEDPGTAANWGVPDYIPAGKRTGLLATFNGGFKLDSADGGFYLNGIYHGSLVKGTASIVYYKNGTIKIGEWGRDFKMNSSIEGVRQNLKLLVDHGKVAADANSDVMSNWGATLGGGYYVWRSGIGVTKDGRVVYVYGPALNAQDLGQLLQRAGAVEGMQMDINPEWMKFDYYQAKGKPGDPTPVPLLPTQQASPYTYYTPSTRDFTAVYAR